MHDQTITFLLAGGDGERLRPLTSDKPKSLVPFGGPFRILDFALSNILNSQLRRLYLLTQYQHERVSAYIREGWAQLSKEFRWDRGEDLTCIAPPNGREYRGSADAVFQNLEFVEHSRAELVLIVAGDQIREMDFGRMLRHHMDSQADLTTCGPGAHVFRRDVLIQLLRKHVGENSGVSFEKDIIPGVIRSGRAALFHFSGYCRTITTLDDYYAANMDFASSTVELDAYESVVWPIRTLSGTKQLQKVRSAVNSRVALGARLIGCKVSNSVVASGVRVETGAQIENSIILGGSHVGSGARLRNAIVCEGATIAAFDQIGFNEELDRKRFNQTSAGIIIVPGGSGDRPQYVQRRSARVATKAHCAVAR